MQSSTYGSKITFRQTVEQKRKSVPTAQESPLILCKFPFLKGILTFYWWQHPRDLWQQNQSKSPEKVRERSRKTKVVPSLLTLHCKSGEMRQFVADQFFYKAVKCQIAGNGCCKSVFNNGTSNIFTSFFFFFFPHSFPLPHVGKTSVKSVLTISFF